MRRRANREGTLYRDGPYWVAEVSWVDDRAVPHRLRRKRKTQSAAREALMRLRIDAHAQPESRETVADVLRAYVESRAITERTRRDYSVIVDRCTVRCTNRRCTMLRCSHEPSCEREQCTRSDHHHVIATAFGRLAARSVRRDDIAAILDSFVTGYRRHVYMVLHAALPERKSASHFR
ncbi:MAG: hypothetical protein ACYDGM_08975 [Vulcanimicrobiaceae bacterium]